MSPGPAVVVRDVEIDIIIIIIIKFLVGNIGS